MAGIIEKYNGPLPGEVMSVTVRPYRWWGNRIREDVSAEPIELMGNINKVILERDLATDELTARYAVIVGIPIIGSEAVYPMEVKVDKDGNKLN